MAVFVLSQFFGSNLLPSNCDTTSVEIKNFNQISVATPLLFRMPVMRAMMPVALEQFLLTTIQSGVFFLV
ncbi:hypothetical protein A9Q94_15625 [Rhodobacterales bacterium 56_14_T64]|nr:hypothetical protein A9Q94_15625 [Rhodobacterales bacterium 56_14_T64]